MLPIVTLVLLGLGVFIVRRPGRAGRPWARFSPARPRRRYKPRHALSPGLGRIRHGGESGPASRWTYAHRRALRIGAVALAALIFVFWGQPTAAVVIVIAVLLLVVLGLIEVIGRPPAQPSPAPPAPHG